MDGGKSHWKAQIAGVQEEWDAETTKLEQDKVIGWRSINGLENSGEVRFTPVNDGTKLTVHIEYNPPAGILGDAAEAIYVGREFDNNLEADLQRFRDTVEQRAAA